MCQIVADSERLKFQIQRYSFTCQTLSDIRRLKFLLAAVSAGSRRNFSQLLMASKKVFDAMEAGDWGRAKEVIASTSWTPVDLQQQHGVQNLRNPRYNNSCTYHFLLKYLIKSIDRLSV